MTISAESDARAENSSQKELPQRSRRWLLGLILAGYLIVTVLYGLVNPLFEAPDEHWHYFTAQFISENGRLPYVAPGNSYDEWLSQEAAQPPLYYILGGLLVSPIDTTDARDEVWHNKFRSIGDASDLININRFVHGQQEAWPWEGYALAAHILRWFSTLLGLGTLICIYLAARLLWPRDSYRALLATALVAFLPQYNFVHAAVSNDPLIIFLVSAALWQLIGLWQKDVTRARLALLGITIGLASLAKNAGITLLFYALGALLLLAIRNRTADEGRSDSRYPAAMGGWRLIGATLAWVVLPAILIAGWLWARNWSLYGDFTATNQFIRIAGGDRNYALQQVLRESRGLWLSTFAVFGWFNLRAPDWIHWFWSGLAGLALAGGCWRAVKNFRLRKSEPAGEQNTTSFWQRVDRLLQQSWFLPLLLALWVVAVYASLVLFMLQTEAAQGRLLFPALLPLALGLASGLTATTWLRRVSFIFPLMALFTTLYCLYYVVQPAYEVPSTVAGLPTEAQELDVDMGMGIKLIGVSIESDTTFPGEPLWLTLYWRGNDVTEKAPEFVLSVFGRDHQEIGKVHSYHGRGLYPAGLWPEGKIIADRFGLWIDEAASAPVLATVDSTLLKGATVQVGEIKVEPLSWPPLEEEILAQFGTVIELLDVRVSPQSARPGDLVAIDVTWQAAGEPEEDLNTLVHLGQPDSAPLATGDRPPLDGRYPTRVWENGEQIDDHYELLLPDDLATGRFPLWIGMYNPQTMVRLPILIEDEAQPFAVYLAGWIEVE